MRQEVDVADRSEPVAPFREPNDLRLGGFVDRHTMRFVRDYPHPPAQIWAALTDAAQLGVWLWPCESFDARLGGIGVFDPGVKFSVRITEFEPERLLDLGGRIRFELAPSRAGCRLTLDLKRPDDGWSPMALAGFHGWMGKLSRLLAGRPQEETEAWALGIWNSVFAHCEWEVSRFVSGGAKVIWRVHFAPCDAKLTEEAKAQLDELAQLLRAKDLAVTVDGFGDDPCDQEESLRLCAERIEAARRHLHARGIPEAKINTAFVLGNYHYLVERYSEAGRAFNRRIELRPVY